MNIYDYITPNSGEDFTTLLEKDNIKIARIVSSDKLEPKEYCQEEDEFVILLEGKATLEIEGKKSTLTKGESLFIPAKTKHKVLNTQKATLWLAVYFKSN